MAQLMLAVLLLGGVRLEVNYSEMAVHFYGPVDAGSDTLYQQQLKQSMDSLLAEIPLTCERSLGQAVERSYDARDYFRTSMKYPQVVSTRYSTTGQVQNEYVISLMGPFIEELIPATTASFRGKRGNEADSGSQVESSPIPSTGFIIDARGTGYRPGIFPSILDPEGNPILEAGAVEKSLILEKGYVNYAYSPRQALESRQLGLNPLRIVAEKATGSNRCDLVIPAADAERILNSPLHRRLLAECKVTIIIDNPK